MNDEQLKREIEEAFAAEPSPQFVARVRRQIANEPQPSKRRPWAWMAAGLATAAVLLGIVVFQPWAPRTSAPEQTAVAPVPAVAPIPNVDVPQGPAEIHSTVPAVATKSVTQPQPRSPELEVLFDLREAAALKDFLGDVQERKIDPSRLEGLFEAAERAGKVMEPMPIAGLEIEIKPLDPAAQ